MLFDIHWYHCSFLLWWFSPKKTVYSKPFFYFSIGFNLYNIYSSSVSLTVISTKLAVRLLNMIIRVTPPSLQIQNTEILKQIFTEKEYRGLSPNFHIHASVSDLYIPTIGLPILLEEICRPILGLYKSLTDTLIIGAEAALFPEEEYINGTFVAVYMSVLLLRSPFLFCFNLFI